MRIEVEMKNEQLRDMRSNLNSSKADYGNIVLERDELIKRTHQKEEVDAKVNFTTVVLCRIVYVVWLFFEQNRKELNLFTIC